jgi:hypothetical protein
MQTARGYWRPSPESKAFLRCNVRQFCDGGAGGGDAVCAGNRVGPLCSQCALGYKSSSATGDCLPCPKQEQSVGLTVMIILLFVAGIVLLYYIVLRKDRALIVEAAARDRLGRAGGQRREEWKAYREEDDRLFDEKAVLTMAPILTTATRSRPNFTYKLKILVSLFQMMFNVTYIVNIRYVRHARTGQERARARARAGQACMRTGRPARAAQACTQRLVLV